MIFRELGCWFAAELGLGAPGELLGFGEWLG